MEKANNSGDNHVTPISFILFCIFLVLKLTHYIGWSWWWVTSPLWIAIGIVVLDFVVTLLIALIGLIRRNHSNNR